jgi:transposase
MITPPSTPQFKVLIGVDWGDAQHAISLRRPDGSIERSSLRQTPEDLRHWIGLLQDQFPDTPIAVAIETTRGPLINALGEHAFLTVYPIHPATSARYRKAFRPSGAKDDAPDADVLLDLLVQHLPKLRPLVPQDPATRRLAGLVEARRHAVDRRTGVVNALKARLKSYFPLALRLGGEDLHAPMMLDLLDRWPDLSRLKAARPATLRRFFYAHNLRRAAHVDSRLEQIANAQPLTNDDAIIAVAVLEVRAWVDELRVLQKHIRILEQEIATAFKDHPEAGLFRELPGAGPALAPRLLVALGTDRTLYPSASSLQKASGIAPVREKSGGRCWVHWRWNAPKFMRQTFHEWAGQTVVWCAWAKEFYRRQKHAGKSHHAILRALAFKWLRILWKCWQTHTPYQEAIFLNAREKHQAAASVPS